MRRMTMMDPTSTDTQNLVDELLHYPNTLYMVLAGVVVVAVLLYGYRAFRFWRRNRVSKAAFTLHPKLQKYAGRSDDEIEADRLASEKIIASSLTDRITGYELVRQIEVVFVEDCRSQQDAMMALKAAAGRIGGNAIVNVSLVQASSGKYGGRGNAVVVRPKVARSSEPPR